MHRATRQENVSDCSNFQNGLAYRVKDVEGDRTYEDGAELLETRVFANLSGKSVEVEI